MVITSGGFDLVADVLGFAKVEGGSANWEVFSCRNFSGVDVEVLIGVKL